MQKRIRETTENTALNELLEADNIARNFAKLWTSIEAADTVNSKLTVHNSQTHFPDRAIFSVHWAWPTAVAASLTAALISSYFAANSHAFSAPPQALSAQMNAQTNYQTLADSSSNYPTRCGQLRIRFIDDLSQLNFRTMLLAAHASIIDGPSALGTYTLKTTEPEFALQTLKQFSQVTVIEPVSC